MTIGEAIDKLNECEVGMMFESGFGMPHSYRGYYDELAVEPMANVRVSDMLHALDRGLTETFEGYKGGDYTYNEDTTLNLAHYGMCGGGELSYEQFDMMLNSAFMDEETQVKEKTMLLKRDEARKLIDVLDDQGFNDCNEMLTVWADSGLVVANPVDSARILARKASPGSGTEPSLQEVRRMINYYEQAIEELENGGRI
jgi:hypothetical protein